MSNSRLESTVGKVQDGTPGVLLRRLQWVFVALFAFAGAVIFSSNTTIQFLGFDFAQQVFSGSSTTLTIAHVLTDVSFAGVIVTNLKRVLAMSQRLQAVVVGSFLFTVLMPFIPMLSSFVLGSAFMAGLGYTVASSGVLAVLGPIGGGSR